MRVLGVDPGIADTGWALLEPAAAGSVALLESGLVKTSPSQSLPERLHALHRGLRSVIADHRPDCAAVEEMFFLKAAHTVRATLQARGVILLSLAESGLPVSEYNPSQVKTGLTGSGSADKLQVQRMVRSALGLSEILRPDHVADAAAIALCHLRMARVQRLKVLDRLGGGKR
ncbi:MAG: crossover junction endodeoxyribonuclease RuvC [Elusimicrobiota bacterium]|jgi:crossover junction endodeoxyribonuclease RuvC